MNNPASIFQGIHKAKILIRAGQTVSNSKCIGSVLFLLKFAFPFPLFQLDWSVLVEHSLANQMWKCFFHSIHKLLALESYKPLCSIVLRSPPTFFPSYCNHKEKDQFAAQIIGITSRIKRSRLQIIYFITMSAGIFTNNQQNAET